MGINKFTDCVLLVDDDPVNGFINAQLISRLGVADTVKTASDALEAVDFIRQCCLLEEDELCSMLIFLDVHSTAYNGTELLNMVNSMTRQVLDQVEIIILTASPEKINGHSAEGSKVLGVIEKPLTKEKLEKIITKNVQLE